MLRLAKNMVSCSETNKKGGDVRLQYYLSKERGAYRACEQCGLYLWEEHSCSKDAHLCSSCVAGVEVPTGQGMAVFRARLAEIDRRTSGKN